MNLYVLRIVAVSGEEEYTYVGEHKENALAFLRQHDHEGSSLTLTIAGEGVWDDSDEVYRQLGYVPGPGPTLPIDEQVQEAFNRR